MNYICDICKGYTAQPLCVRISEEKLEQQKIELKLTAVKSVVMNYSQGFVTNVRG